MVSNGNLKEKNKGIAIQRHIILHVKVIIPTPPSNIFIVKY